MKTVYVVTNIVETMDMMQNASGMCRINNVGVFITIDAAKKACTAADEDKWKKHSDVLINEYGYFTRARYEIRETTVSE